MAKARLINHFRGLRWTDVQAMRLDEFRALVDAMNTDHKARRSRARQDHGTRREPVMT